MVRFSDVISRLDLGAYPKLALVIFAGVFVLVALRVGRCSAGEMNRAASLPVREDEPDAGGSR